MLASREVSELAAQILVASPYVDEVFVYEGSLIAICDNHTCEAYYAQLRSANQPVSRERRLAVADAELELDYDRWPELALYGQGVPDVWIAPLDWRDNPNRLRAIIGEQEFPEGALLGGAVYDPEDDRFADRRDAVCSHLRVIFSEEFGQRAVQVRGLTSPRRIVDLAKLVGAFIRVTELADENHEVADEDQYLVDFLCNDRHTGVQPYTAQAIIATMVEEGYEPENPAELADTPSLRTA